MNIAPFQASFIIFEFFILHSFDSVWCISSLNSLNSFFSPRLRSLPGTHGNDSFGWPTFQPNPPVISIFQTPLARVFSVFLYISSRPTRHSLPANFTFTHKKPISYNQTGLSKFIRIHPLRLGHSIHFFL